MEEQVAHVKVKICGLTREEEAQYLSDAGADYAGFVFYEKSKRNVSIDQAVRIKKKLNPSIRSVAVTVDPDIDMIKKIEEAGFNIIQIHGGIKKEAVGAASIPVWAAVNAKTSDEAEERIRAIEDDLGELKDKIEAYIFDAPSFGSGIRSDWTGGRRPGTDKLFVLAGGLDSENVAEGIRIFNPDIVDASSSVEGAEGKDRNKVSDLINAARKGGNNE